MSKQLGLKLLDSLQCMYQQGVILREDKTAVANEIASALKNGNYEKVAARLRSVKCQVNGKEKMIENAIKVAEGGN